MNKNEQGKQFDISEEEFLMEIEKMEAMELEELEKIAAEAENAPHQFSKEFEAWKEAFIREKENEENAAASEESMAKKPASRTLPFIYRFINTPLKKAAVVAVLVGAVALAAGGSTYAGKYPIVKFIQKIYDDYVGMENPEPLHDNDEKPERIEKEYELGWVPEGYQKNKERVFEDSARYIYESKVADKQIRLEQYCVYMYFSIKKQDGYKETKYEGNKYYYLEAEDEISVVWYKDGYQFSIRGDIILDEALKMAASIKEL